MGRKQKTIHPTNEKTYEELIKDKSSDIKLFVDEVFRKDTAEIRKILEGAIAHKSISFRFMNDSTNELYKNIQLFVNDGIDRPLHEKGTGIQSAIIISLFSLYCNDYHNNSSLLITEEPELFLHPQARRVISAELDKFLNGSETQRNQLIISTHSIEYLKNVDPFNIVRVYKDSIHNCSIVKQLNIETSQQISLELKRFLWSNNTELFFADKVILVERGEVYLIPAIVDKIKEKNQLLDYENITVSRVNGKGTFLIYIKMLECFNIPYVILGDLDCFKDEILKFVNHLKLDDIKKNVIAIKKVLNDQEVNYEGVAERIKNIDKNFDAQKLQNFFEKFIQQSIEKDDIDLLTIIDYMKSRYTKGNKEISILENIGSEVFNETQAILKQNNIFVWSKGELETYYTEKAKAISGSKDIKALELSYLLKIESETLEDLFLNVEEVKELIEIILYKQ